jgi:hypothetical protein
MADVLIFLFLLFGSVAAWLLDRRIRAAARARGEEPAHPRDVPAIPASAPEVEAGVPPRPPIPLRPPLVIRPPGVIGPRDARASRRPAPARRSSVRIDRRRARPVTVARARDGMVLSVILGPCRGMDPPL